MSTIHLYPHRLLLVTGASSGLLLALSAAVAVYLNTQQERTAAALNENIGSRRAAADLRETLTDLVALHRRGVSDVDPLQDRGRAHLAEIERLADKSAEKSLARSVVERFDAYLALWRARGSSGAAAAQYLVTQVIPACDRLRDFNAVEIEKSELEHQSTLRRLAWGFMAVGVLGSAAGILFGYGMARGLRRAVDSLLIRIEGASGVLGQELATVEWRGDGRPGPGGLDDLTDRVEKLVRQLQQRDRDVRRAERLAAVGQLAAGMAHEIRNPLTSVQLLIQAARRDPTAGLTDDDLGLIDGELGRIEQLVRTLLDYARPPRLERTTCELRAVAEGAIQLVRGRAARQGVEVRFDPPAAPADLHADPGQLRQVLVNLLLNALDAMPTGGSLEVAVGREGGRETLAVSDTGPGIAADVLPRLFEPFATGKEAGVGLGLVTCKRIVEDHGGSVRGFNRPGGGATFLVTLPAE